MTMSRTVLRLTQCVLVFRHTSCMGLGSSIGSFRSAGHMHNTTCKNGTMSLIAWHVLSRCCNAS